MELKKGTVVCLKTTNGGEVVAPLSERYRPTYDAVIVLHGHHVRISALRICSVQPVTTRRAA